MSIFYIFLIATFGVVGLIIFWSIAKYNKFIYLSNLASEAWSGIDIQLKRRYDLIPNLVETVKGYAKHESSVFEDIAKLRSASMNATTVEQKSEAEVGLTQALKTLFAVVENYPELKANQNFLVLQQELTNIENQIQLARRYYNGVVRDYNIAIRVFPGSVVAGIFHFDPKTFFELSSVTERENPQVKF
jgi:LemA protein